jgi:hypothetical protein
MKRPSIFIYQFHRCRIIQAQGLYLYLITPSRHFTLFPKSHCPFPLFSSQTDMSSRRWRNLPLGVHGSDMSNVA